MGLAVFLLLMSSAFVSFAFTAFRLFSFSIALFILADVSWYSHLKNYIALGALITLL